MILMNDFTAESEEHIQAELVAIERVIRSGWYVLGKEGVEFERQWAASCGTSHTIGVANGMDAIEIALRAMDVGAGDEVITTPMTAFASVLAILRAGATPVLADIDAETGLMSLKSVERCITSRTKAVLLVHLYGQIKQMAAWKALCERHDIELVEDCAQAHLAKEYGQVAGSFGRCGAYSFYPTKNLGAIGDGGALVTSDSALAKKAVILRNYGQSERYYHPEFGLNSRLDEIQAALLTVRLGWLQQYTERRQYIASRYRQQLDNVHVRLLQAPTEQSAHVYHLFVLLSPQRDALQAHLHNAGVQSLIHYPVPIHHQEKCKEMCRDPAGLACSENHALECLSIPCHPYMTEQEIQTVINSVNAFQG
jgi:dTDP-4-amino-4,6-dideoxygalactose transaminase